MRVLLSLMTHLRIPFSGLLLVSHNPLHPLTVVVTSETHACTVFTKEILVDPQRVLCSLRP